MDDFSILIATPNGSGSQSPNHILAKSFFRSGYSVGAKNIFPSNIAGLPTWFAIRVNQKNYGSMKRQHEIVMAKNADTYKDDLLKVKEGGYYFYDQEFKIDTPRSDVTLVPIPFRELSKDLSDSIKMRKLLSNTVYLGVMAELLKVDNNTLEHTLRDYFIEKESVIEVNLRSLNAGREFARANLNHLNFKFSLAKPTSKNNGKLFIDGNSAAALGALQGGCTMFSWYPITPATSLAESFHSFAAETRAHRFAQVQAEDELSAVNMVIGAGWAGARAMTSTSGPGLSLMAEGAGLSYFAEIPAVIWDVQRAGPSTGLPTRTLQGDLRSATHLSHGDTEHIVLLPANPAECFDMAELAFDLAEEIQTLVVVLSDLDIGMNYYITDEFKTRTTALKRGKVLNAHDLNQLEDFARYKDVDGDGIGYRTLPGTPHVKAAYFTRGTAHNDKSGYSEDGENFKALLERLKRKMQTAQKFLPKPIYKSAKQADYTIVTYGSSDQIVSELQDLLAQSKIVTDYLRIRALPLDLEIEKIFSEKKKIFIIEQNRDGQMREIITQKLPHLASKFQSILQYDGLPLSAELVYQKIIESVRP